jgi:23S rRNA (adenine2503-C2)-methyltransferase
MDILKSEIDSSVNFIEEQLVGFLESRYVRKVDDYFIAYLSSQTGCNRGCKFCHLTATSQTTFSDSSIGDFVSQWNNIEKYYMATKKPAKYVHFNFMARGEPLANKHLIKSGDDLLVQLGNLAKYRGLKAKFNISTIMPATFNWALSDVFSYTSPTIYYSLYSVKDGFRKKWLPTAMPVLEALAKLKEYQNFSKKIVKIHHAFIKDENDSREDVEDMCKVLNMSGLAWEFNLVRYNPFSPEQGSESMDINALLDIVRCQTPNKVQMIPRVGLDVKASCGMFIGE